MSQTDTRPGFRLPWTADRPDADSSTNGTAEASGAEAPAESDSDTADGPTGEVGDMNDTTPAEELVTTEMTDTAASSSARRPTKFMADLSRAMQSAAETSRDEAMTRFAAEAKVAVEDIRASSAEEAAGLRRQADDDVAAVREWSKTEIARIREETDSRIAARKQALDGEMDAFAAVIEARVDRVNRAVSEYENEMAEFFERLLAEQDPTRIATMAQAMPDPPELSALAAAVTEGAPRIEPAGDTEGEAETMPAEGQAEVDEAPAPEGEASYDDGSAETTPEAAVEGETFTEGEAQTAEGEPAAEPEGEPEPAPDFAAAEAEAAAMSGELDADDGLTMLAAARLDSADNDLSQPAQRSASGDRVTTRVVVLGLVSVASIATFKRSLGRVSGVSAIGVASGPDGEFVFTVSHDAGLSLANAITALPGFDARISAETPGGLEVAAHDPDSAD
jgi:hypothetical protein